MTLQALQRQVYKTVGAEWQQIYSTFLDLFRALPPLRKITDILNLPCELDEVKLHLDARVAKTKVLAPRASCANRPICDDRSAHAAAGRHDAFPPQSSKCWFQLEPPPPELVPPSPTRPSASSCGHNFRCGLVAAYHVGGADSQPHRFPNGFPRTKVDETWCNRQRALRGDGICYPEPRAVGLLGWRGLHRVMEGGVRSGLIYESNPLRDAAGVYPPPHS